MERNGLIAFTLHHGTILERSERLFWASGNWVYIGRDLTNADIETENTVYIYIYCTDGIRTATSTHKTTVEELRLTSCSLE